MDFVPLIAPLQKKKRGVKGEHTLVHLPLTPRLFFAMR